MQQKKAIVIGIVACALIVGIAWWMQPRSRQVQPTVQTAHVLGDDVALVAFTTHDKPTGVMYVRVPFVSSPSTTTYLAVTATFGGKTVVVASNLAARAWDNAVQKFYFTADPSVVNGTDGSVLLELRASPNGAVIERKQVSVAFTKQELVDVMDLKTVTKPDLSMKGTDVLLAQVPQTQSRPTAPAPAQAPEGLPGGYKNDRPDLKQRKAECAPTAAANGLIGLAGDHGMIGNLPGTPTELIDQLKGSMNWTPADGVVPADFVAGKDALAAKLGLPITTAQVGDAKGNDTLGKIMDGLDNGGAAELRLRFVDPASGKTVGGHMVSVTNVYTQDGRDYIDVHDPMSSQGTDTYEVKNGQIMNYGLNPGTNAYVSVGFVQTWTGTLPGGAMQPLTPGELQGLKPYQPPQTIKVIPVQGHLVPLSEVYVGTGPDCDAPHYHATGGKATALDGTVIVDPEGCGFGRVRDVPVQDAQVK